MIQRIKKPRRAALRNSFHWGCVTLGAPEALQGQAELGAGAGYGQWAPSCLQAQRPAHWKDCLHRGWSVVALRGPQRSSKALGCWLRTLQSCWLHPLGRRGEQNFPCGRKNRRPSPPSPTFQGLGQGPKASRTLEGSLGQGKIGPGGGGFKLKSVTGFLTKAISTRHLDSSPYPNPENVEATAIQASVGGIRWGWGRFLLLIHWLGLNASC